MADSLTDLFVVQIVREQCWLNELLLMLPWEPENTAPRQSSQLTSFLADPLLSAEERTTSSEQLLTSILAGTLTPASIPVTVYLPSASLPPLGPSQHLSTCAPTPFAFGGLGPPPVSGSSSGADSLFDTDIDMDMEIPGLSMSMNSSSMIDAGIGMSVGGLGMELGGSATPPRPPPMIILSSPARAPAAGLVELRASFVQGSRTSGECGVKVESLPGVETRGMEEIVRRGGIWGLAGRIWTRSH